MAAAADIAGGQERFPVACNDSEEFPSNFTYISRAAVQIQLSDAVGCSCAGRCGSAAMHGSAHNVHGANDFTSVQMVHKLSEAFPRRCCDAAGCSCAVGDDQDHSEHQVDSLHANQGSASNTR